MYLNNKITIYIILFVRKAQPEIYRKLIPDGCSLSSDNLSPADYQLSKLIVLWVNTNYPTQ